MQDSLKPQKRGTLNYTRFTEETHIDTQSELRKGEFTGIYRINRIRKSKHHVRLDPQRPGIEKTGKIAPSERG
jgi:hypothetical protein